MKVQDWKKGWNMKFVSMIFARLKEASTYAGLSAICVTISMALSLTGTARYAALLVALVTGIGAVAKSEHNARLSAVMDEAAQLIPVIATAVVSVEALLPAASKPHS